MSPLYDFQCPSGHIHERIAEAHDHSTALCPACGEPSERLMSVPQRPVVRGGTPTHFPGKHT